MMTPFQTPFELMNSDRLQGATDLYQVLLTLKHGFGNGESKLGCYSITKADAKRVGIKWDAVVSMVRILDLKITNRNGRWGHVITK
jgi:hypothetical protein